MCRSPPSEPPSSKCTSCLLLLSFPHFSAGYLRFPRVVGAGDVFSTSRTINFQKVWEWDRKPRVPLALQPGLLIFRPSGGKHSAILTPDFFFLVDFLPVQA